MARIRWVDEGDASGELAGLYQRIKETARGATSPTFMKTMSIRPDFLTAIHQASAMHFSEGYLTRAQHEMIAADVSAVNRCHY